MLRARDLGFALDAGDVARLVGGTAAMAAAWGALGVAIGAVVRNQVAAIVGLSV